jgi:hypothetical protein
LPDATRKAEIARVQADHPGMDGAGKVWRQLHREGIPGEFAIAQEDHYFLVE